VGVHKIGKRPHLGNAGVGVQDPYNTGIYDWFRALSERLRYVRVVCGDWSRICGGNWQDKKGLAGIFFDPPYSYAERDSVYGDTDDFQVAHTVREWSLKRGELDSYRIVLAGYFEEHESLLAHGWRVEIWTAQGGYGNLGGAESRGSKNRVKEALFFSPHCLAPAQQGMFK
jgi:hypothetical protein